MVPRPSLFRLLSLVRVPALNSTHELKGMERIRTAMLRLLAAHEGAVFYRVAERVRYADEMESLWYLRQDLLAALSAVRGEAAARREMAAVNALFKGLLPPSLTATSVRQQLASS